MQDAIVKRNSSIDLLRFFCAFGVVLVHSGSGFWNWSRVFAFCAVPCFFMISGFLFFSKECDCRDRLKKHMKRMLRLLLVSTFFFAMYKELVFFAESGCIYTPSAAWALNFFLFNDNPFAVHLWYFSAYLYVLACVYIANRLKCYKMLLFSIPFLLMINLIIGNYSIICFHRTFPLLWTRNFFFDGLPFFLIGGLVLRLKKIFSGKIIFVGICVSAIILYLEQMLLISKKLNGDGNIFLGTIPLCMLILLFFSKQNISENLFSEIGRKYSLMIFIVHPIILDFVRNILGIGSITRSEVHGIISFFVPLLVFSLSLLWSFVFYLFQDKFWRSRSG